MGKTQVMDGRRVFCHTAVSRRSHIIMINRENGMGDWDKVLLLKLVYIRTG